ncbi:hypothetical protein EXIGLDRAFT_725911 [Exidia glandulosa HHB12029]|uniref:Uncharacterized protein n=1 Tax=Exidia glandulosa HHB12029 TaxID=1314781 RepID=A0A165MI36_EXIGL|nr:hypothetical protein EXIGLDRAFT_725911 [Exidia glandulosa HHB12029]
MAWHTIAYCCIIGAADLTNMLIYATAPNEMRHLFDGVMFSLVSVSCSRLLLHMRELGDREKTDFFTETDGTELSTLRDLRAMPNASQWQAKVPGRSYGYF